MFNPLGQDALILRRYTANWAAPDDRKVNPWGLNEPDPTDNGTMGTIPGPVIEYKLTTGDRVIVHFRNKDSRPKQDREGRLTQTAPSGRSGGRSPKRSCPWPNSRFGTAI
jgi:hypothetical protein